VRLTRKVWSLILLSITVVALLGLMLARRAPQPSARSDDAAVREAAQAGLRALSRSP